VADFGVGKNRGIKVGRFFRLVIEPQAGSDRFHAVFSFEEILCSNSKHQGWLGREKA
jgi:hypothetical protein